MSVSQRIFQFTLSIALVCYAVPCDSLYQLYGIESVTLGDRSFVIGNIYSPSLFIGNDTRFQGAIVATNYLKTQDRVALSGEIHWTGTFDKGNQNSIQSTIVKDAVIESCTIPSIPSVAGITDISVPNDSDATLDPGSYGNVIVRARSWLHLNGGEYQIKSLNVEPDARVTWGSDDLADVTINVTGSVQLGDRSDILDDGSLVVNLGGNLNFGTDAFVNGNWSAPQGYVRVPSRTHLSGKILGKTIQMEPDIEAWSRPTLRQGLFDSVLFYPYYSYTWDDFQQAAFRLYEPINGSADQYIDMRNSLIERYSGTVAMGQIVPILTIADTFSTISSGNRQHRQIRIAALAVDTVLVDKIGLIVPPLLQNIVADSIAFCSFSIGDSTYQVQNGMITWVPLPTDSLVTGTITIHQGSGLIWNNKFSFYVDAKQEN